VVRGVTSRNRHYVHRSREVETVGTAVNEGEIEARSVIRGVKVKEGRGTKVKEGRGIKVKEGRGIKVKEDRGIKVKEDRLIKREDRSIKPEVEAEVVRYIMWKTIHSLVMTTVRSTNSLNTPCQWMMCFISQL